MPVLRRDLEDLVRIPSVSAPGSPPGPLMEACAAVERLLEEAGVRTRRLELPDTAPVVMGEIPAPPGAPTVLLYSHYDVVPAGDPALWSAPPFEPTERDGATYGRGTADTKANVVALAGALRAWDGRPPVGIRVVVEGMEEIGGRAFTAYPAREPAEFAADVMVIADAGGVRPGVPTLTVALRGAASVVVEARTLEAACHSGCYGGAAPDALLSLVHALATLHDASGDVAVEGLLRDDSVDAGVDEAEFRALAGVLEGQPLVGTGTLGARTCSGPAITIIGLDATPVAAAVNAVQPYARAKLNVRVHPLQDPVEAGEAVIRHLRAAMPFGVTVDAVAEEAGPGFAARTSSPVYDAARAAWGAAWGADVVCVGTGGSIPIVEALSRAAPSADVLIVGAADALSGFHGPDERVLLDELERVTVALTDFLGRLAEGWGAAAGA